MHGASVEVREGPGRARWSSSTFPNIDDARAWYDSPAYQEILHLRTDHIEGDTLLVEGVPDDYDVHHTAETFRQALASAS